MCAAPAGAEKGMVLDQREAGNYHPLLVSVSASTAVITLRGIGA